jgi:hypothetical protein
MTANRATFNIMPMFIFLAMLAVVGLILLAMVNSQAAIFSAEKPVADTASLAVYQLRPLAPHAQKHPESQTVWQQLSTMDTRFCRYECRGRTYYACVLGDGHWAFAVEDEMNTITAFFTTRNYAIGHARDNPGCKPFMNGAHP